MINFAGVTEQNGVLVALDQEKAYNKILHDYLWRTLEKYNVHKNFTRCHTSKLVSQYWAGICAI